MAPAHGDFLIARSDFQSLFSIQSGSSRQIPSLYRRENGDPERGGHAYCHTADQRRCGPQRSPLLMAAWGSFPFPGTFVSSLSSVLPCHSSEELPVPGKPGEITEHFLTWAPPGGEMRLANLGIAPLSPMHDLHTLGAQCMHPGHYIRPNSTNSWGALILRLNKHPFISTLSLLSLSQFSNHAKIDSLPLTTHLRPILQ